MKELDALLRDKVRMLGNALGNTIRNDLGEDTLAQIETIRKQAKRARTGDENERDKLLDLLKGLADDSLVPVVRGFNQFLNLANLAEQQHGISWRREDVGDRAAPLHLDAHREDVVEPAEALGVHCGDLAVSCQF